MFVGVVMLVKFSRSYSFGHVKQAPSESFFALYYIELMVENPSLATNEHVQTSLFCFKIKNEQKYY